MMHISISTLTRPAALLSTLLLAALSVVGCGGGGGGGNKPGSPVPKTIVVTSLASVPASSGVGIGAGGTKAGSFTIDGGAIVATLDGVTQKPLALKQDDGSPVTFATAIPRFVDHNGYVSDYVPEDPGGPDFPGVMFTDAKGVTYKMPRFEALGHNGDTTLIHSKDIDHSFGLYNIKTTESLTFSLPAGIRPSAFSSAYVLYVQGDTVRVKDMGFDDGRVIGKPSIGTEEASEVSDTFVVTDGGDVYGTATFKDGAHIFVSPLSGAPTVYPVLAGISDLPKLTAVCSDSLKFSYTAGSTGYVQLYAKNDAGVLVDAFHSAIVLEGVTASTGLYPVNSTFTRGFATFPGGSRAVTVK